MNASTSTQYKGPADVPQSDHGPPKLSPHQVHVSSKLSPHPGYASSKLSPHPDYESFKLPPHSDQVSREVPTQTEYEPSWTPVYEQPLMPRKSSKQFLRNTDQPPAYTHPSEVTKKPLDTTDHKLHKEPCQSSKQPMKITDHETSCGLASESSFSLSRKQSNTSPSPNSQLSNDINGPEYRSTNRSLYRPAREPSAHASERSPRARERHAPVAFERPAYVRQRCVPVSERSSRARQPADPAFERPARAKERCNPAYERPARSREPSNPAFERSDCTQESSVSPFELSTYARESSASVFKTSTMAFESSALPKPYKSASGPQQAKSNTSFRPVSRQMTRVGSGLRECNSLRKYTCGQQKMIRKIGETKPDIAFRSERKQTDLDVKHMISSTAAEDQNNEPVIEVKSQRRNMIIKDEPSEQRRKRAKAKAYTEAKEFEPISDLILEDLETTNDNIWDEQCHIEEQPSRRWAQDEGNPTINAESKTRRGEMDINDKDHDGKGRNKKRKKSRRQTDDVASSDYNGANNNTEQSYDTKRETTRGHTDDDDSAYSRYNISSENIKQNVDKKRKKSRRQTDDATYSDYSSANKKQTLDKKREKTRQQADNDEAYSDYNSMNDKTKPILDTSTGDISNKRNKNRTTGDKNTVVTKKITNKERKAADSKKKSDKGPRKIMFSKVHPIGNINDAPNYRDKKKLAEIAAMFCVESAAQAERRRGGKPKDRVVYEDEDDYDDVRPGIWNCDLNFKQETKAIPTLPNVKEINEYVKTDMDSYITYGQGDDENDISEKKSCFTGIVEFFRRVFRIK